MKINDRRSLDFTKPKLFLLLEVTASFIIAYVVYMNLSCSLGVVTFIGLIINPITRYTSVIARCKIMYQEKHTKRKHSSNLSKH